jgi:hypothetical protein
MQSSVLNRWLLFIYSQSSVGATYVVVRHLKFPPTFTYMNPLPCGWDGDPFHCAIDFLLQDLKPRDMYLRLRHSIMSVLVATLIIWCIRTAWDSTEGKV